jgi:hypothetical protein
MIIFFGWVENGFSSLSIDWGFWGWLPGELIVMWMIWGKSA